MIAALAIVWELLCVAAALARLLRVRSAEVPGLAALVRPPTLLEQSELLRRAADLSADSPYAARVREVLEIRDDRLAVAELNELLTDVGGTLSALRDVPGAAARMGVTGGLLLAISEVVIATKTATETVTETVTGRQQSVSFTTLALVLGCTLLGAIASLWIGRLAAERAAATREQWNRFSRIIGRLHAVPATQEPVAGRVERPRSRKS